MTKKDYKNDLKENCFHLRKRLNEYKDASFEERKRLAASMSEQVAVMLATLNELERKGVYKHRVRIEHDLNALIKEGTPENYAAVEQDITTLLEFSALIN